MNFKPTCAKDRLILPLDVPTIEEARTIVTETSEFVGVYKIGMQLQFSNGLSFASDLVKEGLKVFLDVKLLDIENTIELAVANIAKMGVSFVTIHAYPNNMQAAVRGLGKAKMCLLGVTVLTSMDNEDLRMAGYRETVDNLVRSRCLSAKNYGMGGIVCSPHEVSVLREIVGSSMVVATPGIRPINTPSDDQKRVATPKQAIEWGSDYLVVGRPIIQSKDRKGAARQILEEIETALENSNSI